MKRQVLRNRTKIEWFRRIIRPSNSRLHNMNGRLFINLWSAVVRRGRFGYPTSASKNAARRRFDQQLRLQAYFDGELSKREELVAEAEATGPEFQALLIEFCTVKSALTAGELERKHPEPRELCWRKIAQDIATEVANENARKSQMRAAWAWRLSPVCGMALGLCAVLLVRKFPEPSQPGPFPPPEIEAALSEVPTLAYRDQDSRLTVVWHYDQSDVGLDQ